MRSCPEIYSEAILKQSGSNYDTAVLLSLVYGSGLYVEATTEVNSRQVVTSILFKWSSQAVHCWNG